MQQRLHLHSVRPGLWHGADYNPEQWLDYTGVLEQDIRLMKVAGISTATIGIFSWAMLEPEEGRYEFAWLDRVFDMLHKAEIGVVLATPSGGKPNWMALKYDEIRRVDRQRQREPQERRHNHCLTSPVYRAKVHAINTQLAQRYGSHPALSLWHLSNEYGGYCYCPLCFTAFRSWLKAKYKTIDKLNHKYWAQFWSHTFGSFDEITTIDESVHCLTLDWKRFMTEQVCTFIENEAQPIRQFSPKIPITNNLMGVYEAYDYWKIAAHLDVISFDSYPAWHGERPDWHTAGETAFLFDLNRCLKSGAPWALMESTPSQASWMPVSRLKRPGMLRLASLQAVAHGSDTVMYFQWRKSRGGCEKFHGAVVDHTGHEHTRVFQNVSNIGADLKELSNLAGAASFAEVAVIYDWENAWGIAAASGPRKTRKDYAETVADHYRAFWKLSVPVDVLDQTVDLSGYKLVIAPMCYMLRPGFAERIREFVSAGGTFVTTYFSGLVDEHDLCFLDGFPGPLKDVLGIWVEETDTLEDSQKQKIRITSPALGLTGTYGAKEYCDLVHLRGASAVAVYGSEFYADTPALTLNEFGKGRAIYIASRNETRFIDDLGQAVVLQLGIRRLAAGEVVPGVNVQERCKDRSRFLFAMNFTDVARKIDLATAGIDLLTNDRTSGTVDLPPYGVAVVQCDESPGRERSDNSAAAPGAFIGGERSPNLASLSVLKSE